MLKTKLTSALLATSTLFMLACSGSKVPGKWTAYNLNNDVTVMSANFVNENVGWLNGWKSIYVNPEQTNANGNANANANANRNTKPKKPGEITTLEPAPNEGFVVLQTNDGGQTWSEIPDLYKNKIRSVWFIDPQEGWALTIERNIVHTTDGGLNWTLQRPSGKVKAIMRVNGQPTDVPEQLESIRFADNVHGWAWGGGQKREVELTAGSKVTDYSYPGIFLVTLDGGQNWSQIPYPFEREVVKTFFLNFRYGWANVAGGGFYKTSDGGLTWAKVDTKLPQPLLRSIFFVDENAGWVVDGDGRIAKTTDSGRTWKKLYDIKDEFKMNDIYFTDASHGWAVGENGVILYTTDGEATWLIADTGVNSKLQMVTFTGKNTGWVIGQFGTVLRYQGSGQ